MTKIDLELPDSLAREAEAAGLLSSRAVAKLLREEMRRAAARRLLEGAARATAAGSIPLSLADIQREVDAVRKARRSGVRKAT
ncbi:MAG: hypothetical protein ABIW83_01970 [Allosphingosinicella sp.]